jgi:hypothetical protein
VAHKDHVGTVAPACPVREATAPAATLGPTPQLQTLAAKALHKPNRPQLSRPSPQAPATRNPTREGA